MFSVRILPRPLHSDKDGPSDTRKDGKANEVHRGSRVFLYILHDEEDDGKREEDSYRPLHEMNCLVTIRRRRAEAHHPHEARCSHEEYRYGEHEADDDIEESN